MPAREINSPVFISSVCLLADAELETAHGEEGNEDHTSHEGAPRL